MEDNKIPESMYEYRNIHYCVFDYAGAIEECYQDKEGRLWAHNEEYETQVNFCPMCGHEAPTKIGE